MLTSTLIASYLALGAVAGLLAGLLGIGGGLIIVPALVLLFAKTGISPDIGMRLAIGTSLATIIFTSLSSTWAHHQKGAVQWPVARYLSGGIILGAGLGTYLTHHTGADILRLGFGLFELAVALQLGLGFQPKPHRQLPSPPQLAPIGAVIGGLSAMVGVGGGSLTVPFLAWCNVAIRQAIATAAACGLPIAVAGTIGSIGMGWQHPALPDYTVGYVNLPATLGISLMSVAAAPFGAQLAHWLNPVWLKRLFALILALVAMKMLRA